MTIQSTPPISLQDIVNEFGGAISEGLFAFYRGGKYVPASVTQVPASGAISLYDFLGTRKSAPGSVEWTMPGQYEFIVPAYTTMTVEVAGAGGGAGSSIHENYGAPIAASGNNGFAGSESRFLTLVGAGGGGGGGGVGTGPYSAVPGSPGAPGVASGGTTNTPGGGSLGGAGTPYITGLGPGGNGGNGGLTERTYTIGETGSPVPGEKTIATVGVGAPAGAFPGNQGTNGANGRVKVSWT